MTDILMTVPEVAAFLKLSEASVYAKVAEGSMPHYKLGGAIRFSMEQIEHYLGKNQRGGEPKKAPRPVKLKHLS